MEIQWILLVAMVTVVMVIVLPRSEGCSCMRTHPQDAYCRSHFVIKAKVRKVETIMETWEKEENGTQITEQYPAYKAYTVRVYNLFHKTDEYQNSSLANDSIIYSPHDGSMCGVNLRVKKQYLLMGRVQKGKAKVTLCNEHRLYKEHMTPGLRRTFKKSFKTNCHCQIENCYQPGCDKKNSRRNVCMWYINSDPGFCYFNPPRKTPNNTLRKKSGCRWNKSKAWLAE